MTGRERFLTVLNNKQPDRLACQVHGWMDYYLRTYLGGIDQYAAYERFGMDPVIYVSPNYIYHEADLAKWEVRHQDLGVDSSGSHAWHRTIVTPGGELQEGGAYNHFTGWTTEHLIKNERDFELWNTYVPLPRQVDWTPVTDAKKRIGDRGIVRGSVFDFGQGSPWQSFSNYLYGTEPAILTAYDNPDWLHYVLKHILNKKLQVIEAGGRMAWDIVETGGGGGSSTVISPSMHQEFCLPYDQIQHQAIHEQGPKIVYHLCGGLMPLLDIVALNGADGLETMTPPEMGGDCDLRKADEQVGDKLFFIGGFNQNGGFENGTPEAVRSMVLELFEAARHGGFILSPSDHFFFGNPDNIQTFVDTVRECIY